MLATPAQPLDPDTRVMNAIALVLGRPQGWGAVNALFEEIARAIASTGRPRLHDGGLSRDPRTIIDRPEHFTAAHPCPVDDVVAARDWHSLNDLVVELVGAEWTPHILETVAGAVAATARPHPGGSLDGDRYVTALALWTGKGPVLPTGTLVIEVDDGDLPDNPFEPWTATASWRTGERATAVVAVGGGASIPAALRALADELDLRGVFGVPTTQERSMPSSDP